MKIKNKKSFFLFFILTFSFPLQASHHISSHSKNTSTTLFPAINKPKKINLNDPWNAYLGLSFIWLNASEEGLCVAISDSSGSGLPITDSIPIHTDFKYKPGFKALLGFNFALDNWSLETEYFWLHLKDNISTTAPQPSPPGVLYPLYSIPANNGVVLDTASCWDLGLDFLDIHLSRDMYTGKKLTFKPFWGGKIAWITQKLDINYQASSNQNTYRSLNQSSSWAIGPKMGVDSKWIIGKGFKLIGSFATALLFTKYTISKEENNASAPADLVLQINETIRYLRPFTQLGSGFAWGSFFSNFQWYVNIEILYDFYTMFGQNVFRQFFNSPNLGLSKTNFGNLYLHGLILNAKLDF